MKPNRDERRGIYNSLFNTAYVLPDHEGTVEWYIKKLIPKIDRYKKISDECKIPWYMLACIHSLEGAMDFNNNIQNGQSLSKKTTIVPVGKGPYASFEDSVREEFLKTRASDIKDYSWDIADVLWFLESHNGFGYYYKKINTPYLWSFTNHYKTGYYVRDGVFDGAAVSKQAGAVAIILGLVKHGYLSFKVPEIKPVEPLEVVPEALPDITQDVVITDTYKPGLIKRTYILISEFFKSIIKKLKRR